MKTVLVSLPLIFSVAIITSKSQDWDANGGSFGGVPTMTQSHEQYLAARTINSGGSDNIIRVCRGTVYNVAESKLWNTVGSKLVEKNGNVAILESRIEVNFRTHERRISYSAITNFNYDLPLGNSVTVMVMRVGVCTWNGQQVNLYDAGTRYVPESPAATQVASQSKTADELKRKGADAISSAKERALKMNQQAADQGDGYGLMRMGERYRDGEGVEKDPAKARAYLEKAVAVGSIDAKAALDGLPKQ